MTEQLSVLEWAEERLANTLHIAPTKTGDDRAGWLEDAAYWSAIVDELRDVRRLRAALQAAQALREAIGAEFADDLHEPCADCGRHVMCRFHSLLSAVQGHTSVQAHPTPAQEGQWP